MSAAFQHRATLLFAVATVLGIGVAHVRADHEPVIVMPSARGLPPIVDGFDATGAIIEGDWGLYRPGAGTRTIFPAYRPVEIYPPAVPYFPMTGRPPRYGRLEVVPPPNRRKPPPAASFYRSWTTDAPARTVTLYPSWDPPEVIEGEPVRRRRDRPRRYRPRLR